MYDIISAILAINPAAQVSVNAEDLDQITWHADTPAISREDIETKMAELAIVEVNTAIKPKKLYNVLFKSLAR